MSGKAFGSTKRDGAICVFPGCFEVISTQKFIEHFKVHLDGESYTTAFRDQYERSLLDPSLLDLVDDRPLKAVFVASLHRISHVLDSVQTRLSAIEGAVAALVPATPPPIVSTGVRENDVAESVTVIDGPVDSTVAETVDEDEEQDEEPSQKKGKKKRVAGIARWSSRKKAPRK